MYPKGVSATFTCSFLKFSDNTYATTGSPACRRVVDGTAAAGDGTFTHVSGGQWKYVSSTDDMNGDRVSLRFTLTDHSSTELDLFTYPVFQAAVTYTDD